LLYLLIVEMCPLSLSPILFPILFGVLRDITESLGNDELGFQFRQGTERNVKKMDELIRALRAAPSAMLDGMEMAARRTWLVKE
jgi:hypothetical protein